jgi:hypothetical protein
VKRKAASCVLVLYLRRQSTEESAGSFGNILLISALRQGQGGDVVAAPFEHRRMVARGGWESRLAVLSACDRVYVLDAGEVKEEGTHADLLARQGLYLKLYQRQLAEEELEKL